MRTSRDSPLRVDFLPLAGELAGGIGLTLAPGRKDLDWDRDLDADLARLGSVYRATLLVSLLERPEYLALGVPDLLERAAALGIEPLWFPIRDGEAPGVARQAACRELVARIVTAARGGGTVVIHCRGGLGRSGLVAAGCLVALGREPSAAIALVRAARPGAVETLAQERWVARYAEEIGRVW